MDGIHVVANIGSGTMGHATALQFAWHGYSVRMLDVSDKALSHGMALIDADLATFVGKGIVDRKDVETIRSRIAPTTDFGEALGGADFVIESVLEDLEVKRDVWRHAEECAPEDAIFATNTSGLSPTSIAQVLDHPERFLVAHFYNPAHLMPLVEVVPARQTDPRIVERTVDLLDSVGKHAVALDREAPGFVGNRIQAAVIREALYIIRQGIASPQAVDDIVKYSLGLRWSVLGPVISADLGGLDVFDTLMRYLSRELSSERDADPLLEEKVRDGNLGLKTGHGFYDWTGERGAEIVRDRDERLLDAMSRELADRKPQDGGRKPDRKPKDEGQKPKDES